MDPLTHALAGGLASSSLARDRERRVAVAAGAASGMLADLDFFIHRAHDPLFNIEVHRQFTHSLIFIPIGGLVAALLAYLFLRGKMPFTRLLICTTAAYATAGLLDACTSYGTVLLWPFSDERYAWNLISIVDPIFTAGLIFAVIVTLVRRSATASRVAWVWVLLYLTFGFVQRERAGHLAMELAAERGHVVEQSVVKPTIGNLLLWRSTYLSDDQLYADGIRTGIFTGPRIYPGDQAPLVDPERDFGSVKGTTLYHDLMRMSKLSDGYLVRHPDKPHVVGDARYAMLPTSLTPLWGVVADTTRTDGHLPFQYYRESGPGVRDPFIRMLRGR